MANYIFSRINNAKGELIGVFVKTEGGKKIPFTLRNGNVVRMDTGFRNRPIVSSEEYNRLKRQAAAVLRKNERKMGEGDSREMSRSYLHKHEKDRLDILAANGVNYLADGKLGIRRWIRKTNALAQIPQIVSDLETAIRMMDHILDTYKLAGGEIPELRDIESIINEINSCLVKWELDGRKKRRELSERIAQIVLNLEKCRNEYKKNIRDQLKASLGIMDKRGNINPGATAAKLTAGLARLSARLNQTRVIVPKIALRKELLVMEQDQFEVHLDHAGWILSNLIENRTLDKKSIDLELGKMLYIMSRLWVNPFKRTAILAETVLKTTKSALWRADGLNYQSQLQEIKKILNRE